MKGFRSSENSLPHACFGETKSLMVRIVGKPVCGSRREPYPGDQSGEGGDQRETGSRISKKAKGTARKAKM